MRKPYKLLVEQKLTSALPQSIACTWPLRRRRGLYVMYVVLRHARHVSDRVIEEKLHARRAMITNVQLDLYNEAAEQILWDNPLVSR